MKKIPTFGSRAEVYHNNAKMTTGRLTKDKLMKNKHGRIVSKKKHNTAKKDRRLVKAGYVTEKGKFGAVKKNTIKKGGAKKGKHSGVGLDVGVAAVNLNTRGVSGRVGTKKHNLHAHMGHKSHSKKSKVGMKGKVGSYGMGVGAMGGKSKRY